MYGTPILSIPSSPIFAAGIDFASVVHYNEIEYK